MALNFGRTGRVRSLVCVLGALMILLGLTGIAGEVFADSPPNMEFLNLSLAGVVTGVLLTGLAIVAGSRVTIDEAYNLGHDIGIEAGARQERERHRPVVVDFRYPKNEVEIRRHPE